MLTSLLLNPITITYPCSNGALSSPVSLVPYPAFFGSGHGDFQPQLSCVSYIHVMPAK